MVWLIGTVVKSEPKDGWWMVTIKVDWYAGRSLGDMNSLIQLPQPEEVQVGEKLRFTVEKVQKEYDT